MEKNDIVTSDGYPLFVTLEFQLTDIIWSQKEIRELVRLWDLHYAVMSIRTDSTCNARILLRRALPEPFKTSDLGIPNFETCPHRDIIWTPPVPYYGGFRSDLGRLLAKTKYMCTQCNESDGPAYYKFSLQLQETNIYGLSDKSLEVERIDVTVDNRDPEKGLGKLYYLTRLGYKIKKTIERVLECPSTYTEFRLRKEKESGSKDISKS